MKIIYSFNKVPGEAKYWEREISSASTAGAQFIPFNHGTYLDPYRYIRAQLLDNMYSRGEPALLRMYADIQRLIQFHQAEALLVDNCFPYHPEFLRTLPVFKVLRTTDGSLAAYDRDFAYLHAYDYVLYYGHGYSKDIDMRDKLAYCGVKRMDHIPLGSFAALRDDSKSEATILKHPRDIDILHIGSLNLIKMPFLAAIKRRYGRRFVMRGLTSFKRNLYFCLKFRAWSWISPANIEDYARLYQRAKIGINCHIRDKHAVGNFRLFDLPANGVMQISDGGELLGRYFTIGSEVVGYDRDEEVFDLIDYYLKNDTERERIALGGFRRVNADYRIELLLRRMAGLIAGRLERKVT